MFNYFTKKKKPKITISNAVVTSTLPMQYGEVIGSVAYKKKLKRKKQLEMVVAESGKGRDELDWYKKNSKIINPR